MRGWLGTLGRWWTSRRELWALAWRVAPGRTAAAVAVAIVVGMLPAAGVAVSGLAIGAIPAAVGEGLSSQPGRRLLTLAGALVALHVIGVAVNSVWQYTYGRLQMEVDDGVAELVALAAVTPVGAEHVEDPEWLDTFSSARSEGTGRSVGAAVSALVQEVNTSALAVSAAVLLVPFRWWIPVLLLASRRATVLVAAQQMMRSVKSIVERRQSLRRSQYVADLLMGVEPAKEVRLFGLREWLLDLHKESYLQAIRPIWKAKAKEVPASLATAAWIVLLHGVLFVMLVRDAAEGRVSLTELVIYGQAIFTISASNTVSGRVANLVYGSLAVPFVNRLRDLAAPAPLPAGGWQPLRCEGGEIRFEGVWFAYPGRELPVFAGLDLTIEPGRSMAIVGPNGEGKTTLVKLLCGLRTPDAGRITIDGQTIDDVGAEQWRGRLAVLFQDFVRWELPARDNVGFGALGAIGAVDTAADDARLDRAAREAGATAIVEALPQGWDTPLSRQYEGGVDLSGGEWQRLAIARALLARQCGADVLILDEPTANVDARAEAELFSRFLDVTAGATTILISHRFSTVRRADLICVLGNGAVAELGTHDELLAAGGGYARLFRLQSAHLDLDGAGA